MVDCDNVLNNLSQDWVEFLNKKHGFSVSPQGLSHKEIYEMFGMLSKEEIKFPLQDETFGKSYTVKPGSYEILNDMVVDGHEVTIVTAHNNKTAGMKFEWITKHFPFINREDIIITRKKQKIIGDVLIDDDIRYLEGGNYLKILFNHPNNHGYDAEANGMIRVYSLKEAYEVIQEAFFC
jgi:5'(3')-deoxyribonucleotidase